MVIHLLLLLCDLLEQDLLGIPAGTLDRAGFDGFFSLEWVKRWNPDLQEPGIVFAHYKNYMDSLAE